MPNDVINNAEQSDDKPFSAYQEEAIISLALDHPEFFTSIGRFLKPSMFNRIECQWVIAEILNYFEKYNIVPTRDALRDVVLRSLSEDDPYEEILSAIDRRADPREVPMVKDTLIGWARDRAYGMLYSDDAQEAYVRGDYDLLEQIIRDANRIADMGSRGFWFFKQFEVLFQDDIVDHRTTGFPKLDKILNNGGPSPKEVVCWMGGTNVGKSLILCNNAISSLTGSTPNGNGQDVLLITFELDTIKTAMRCLGVAAKVPTTDIKKHRDKITNILNKMYNTYNKHLAIFEWAPDECSVDNIYALLDNLQRAESWHPDVIIIDYMDLMKSRNDRYNSDDYTRQKHVSNELRGLAKNENVLIFTATQANRLSMTRETADLDSAAESFAKQFALDYVVSINQTQREILMTPPVVRFFVAKNRNGPKSKTITCNVNYHTMSVTEVQN